MARTRFAFSRGRNTDAPASRPRAGARWSVDAANRGCRRRGCGRSRRNGTRPVARLDGPTRSPARSWLPTEGDAALRRDQRCRRRIHARARHGEHRPGDRPARAAAEPGGAGRGAADPRQFRRGGHDRPRGPAADAGLPVLVHAQAEGRGNGPDAEAAAVTDALDAVRSLRGARLHLQHVSTRQAVELIRAAKADGLPVTAEATPHHLTLTSRDAEAMGSHGNVNPPLRSADDRDALRQALVDGVIDVIATDHAPHDQAAKQAGANGFHGFETAVSVILGLGLDGRTVYRACALRPREIVGQSLEEEWILIDPNAEWIVDPSSFRSRGRNTPFQGRRFRGRVIMTVCRGQVVTERLMQHA